MIKVVVCGAPHINKKTMLESLFGPNDIHDDIAVAMYSRTVKIQSEILQVMAWDMSICTSIGLKELSNSADIVIICIDLKDSLNETMRIISFIEQQNYKPQIILHGFTDVNRKIHPNDVFELMNRVKNRNNTGKLYACEDGVSDSLKIMLKTALSSNYIYADHI